jgi:hypothetical protein
MQRKWLSTWILFHAVLIAVGVILVVLNPEFSFDNESVMMLFLPLVVFIPTAVVNVVVTNLFIDGSHATRGERRSSERRLLFAWSATAVVVLFVEVLSFMPPVIDHLGGVVLYYLVVFAMLLVSLAAAFAISAFRLKKLAVNDEASRSSSDRPANVAE